MRKRTAVLISGNGSNLQALIDAASDSDFPAEIVLVISNKATAYGLTRAAQAGIATQILDHHLYSSREAYDAALDAALRREAIELVCLAGFMRLLTPGFVEAWQGRMINIHPSLLPSYRGLDTHARALEDGVRFSGCTVHFVVPEMDAGPIIVQAAVPVLQEDTAETLQQRVYAAEHRIYPLALRWLAGGDLRIEGQRVLLREGMSPAETLINPVRYITTRA